MWLEPSPNAKSFIERGLCTIAVESLESLGEVRRQLVQGLRAHMTGGEDLSDEAYLNSFHKFADLDRLNEVRVQVHREVGASESFRKLVFSCVQKSLIELIGPEIVAQRQINFVTHLPRDTASLLYLHTDAWSGCSPYEVILWLPLVNVQGTKSMFICERSKTEKHLRALKDGLRLGSATELLERVRPDIAPVDMKYGQALLFSPILLHGAEENKTDETRFILNVRFKSLFSPYGTKALGETFVPVSTLPTTELGLAYESEFGVVRG